MNLGGRYHLYYVGLALGQARSSTVLTIIERQEAIVSISRTM